MRRCEPAPRSPRGAGHFHWLILVLLLACHAGAAPYTNPIIDKDLADPGVILDNGTLYFTHTMGGPDIGWPLWKSSDGVKWSFDRHLLTKENKPAWMKSEFWAPEIHKVGNRYVLTFTARSTTNNRFCIGMAFADALTGPYRVQDAPIVQDEVPVIDSHIFQDDNEKKYLLWKRDGPGGGRFGSLRSREMNADCTTWAPGSTEKTLLDSDAMGQLWEIDLIEAPWMLKRDGWYYLIYSGGFIGPEMSYRVGVARSQSPDSGFVRYSENPILKNNAVWGGPGHGGFFRDANGTDWHIYHCRLQANPRDPWDKIPGPGRIILMDRVIWKDGWPTFGNGGTPSTTPQEGPVLKR